MIKNDLEELLNSAKKRAICSIGVSRDFNDSIAISLSGDYDIKFTYNRKALRGVYYISPDSTTLYTYGNNVDQLPVIGKMKSFVKNNFHPKKADDLRAFDDSSFEKLVEKKFIERGVKKLFLNSLTNNCDILGLLTTETNNLVFGFQYFKRIEIKGSIGKGNNIKRYKI